MDYNDVIAMTYDILCEPEELKEIVLRKLNYQLLDIRKDDDYSENHIESTMHCEWQDAGNFIDSKHLQKGIPIVVICYSGQSSMQIASILRLKGYEAYTLHHGYEYYIRNYDKL